MRQERALRRLDPTRMEHAPLLALPPAVTWHVVEVPAAAALAELLVEPQGAPRHVVVNKTPIHPTRCFFTLNNIGTACCPYRVASRAEFVASIEGRGYRLVDEWQNIGQRLELPFESGLSLAHYSGFCFQLAQ